MGRHRFAFIDLLDANDILFSSVVLIIGTTREKIQFNPKNYPFTAVLYFRTTKGNFILLVYCNRGEDTISCPFALKGQPTSFLLALIFYFLELTTAIVCWRLPLSSLAVRHRTSWEDPMNTDA